MPMLVLLDRDGVINQDTRRGVTKPEQLQLIEGSAEAIAQLNAAGAKVAVVTNQSVVGKGLIAAQELDAIHEHLRTLLATKNAHIDAIYACHDHPDKPTEHRKPGAGMLLEALRDFAATPAHTPMVGDALRDLQAAVKAGCPPHLVLSGKGQQTAKEAGFSAIADVQIHDDLYAFVTKWLQQSANTA